MKKGLLILVLLLIVSGCSASDDTTNQIQSDKNVSQQSQSVEKDLSDWFSDRDFETSYDESQSAFIYLNGDSVECNSNAVKISGSTVTITDEGTYVISGTLKDGMIVVQSDKNDKIQIVLDGVSIHSETSAALYILQSDKVFVTLRENTVNELSNGGHFEAMDENNIDAVIFSKEDLTINGTGNLTITSPAGHGIVSKDELTITGGKIEITSTSHGITGKDGIVIVNADLKIASGKDGLHAENDDDESLGYILIESGTFDLDTEGDGISSQSKMVIQGGTFDIVTGGGSENASSQTSDYWGGMRGDRGHGGMGRPGESSSSQSSAEDSTSMKGIKSSGDLLICGGTFMVNSADDSVHSNTNVTIQGGTFEIMTGDDGFHANDTLSIVDGLIHISKSYEGLEGLHVLISGGQIDLTSSDDGINAAGGTDSSGFGGIRGDQFGRSSNGSIVISSGTLSVAASGDGIDANGTLEITGGYTTVTGPTQGDTATLDYDVSAVISSGTFIGTGSSMMAQTFSDSSQGVIALQVGNRSAQTEIILTDDCGNVIVQYAPEMSFAVVIISTEEMIKGKTYSITVGADSGTFEAQ